MNTSIYLSKELKAQLMADAALRGWSLGRGRKSEMQDYIAALLANCPARVNPTTEAKRKAREGNIT